MIRTARLTLRPLGPDDFAALHDIVSDWQVVRQLGSWPWPPDPKFTRSRCGLAGDAPGFVFAIEQDGRMVGTVGLHESKLGVAGIGYSLHRSKHGSGIMTEAVFAALDHGFATYPWDQVEATVWHDNPASARILQKAGFTRGPDLTEHSVARGVETKMHSFTLSRGDYCNIRASVT